MVLGLDPCSPGTRVAGGIEQARICRESDVAHPGDPSRRPRIKCMPCRFLVISNLSFLTASWTSSSRTGTPNCIRDRFDRGEITAGEPSR